jgi:hypothetical protein
MLRTITRTYSHDFRPLLAHKFMAVKAAVSGLHRKHVPDGTSTRQALMVRRKPSPTDAERLNPVSPRSRRRPGPANQTTRNRDPVDIRRAHQLPRKKIHQRWLLSEMHALHILATYWIYTCGRVCTTVIAPSGPTTPSISCGDAILCSIATPTSQMRF